jgi:hypothetical protein
MVVHLFSALRRLERYADASWNLPDIEARGIG